MAAMMKKTFRVLDAVAVRDPYSLRNVHDFMSEIPVTLIPDSALAVPVEIDNPSPGVMALFRQLGNTDFFCFDPRHCAGLCGRRKPNCLAGERVATR